MTRARDLAELLAEKADDARRLALDELDREARESSTFGSKAHRAAREAVERTWDAERDRFNTMSDDELAKLVEESHSDVGTTER
ncbi:MAG: hypothetical protein ACSLFM_02710 [Tepidiformaceae bacterium]